MRTATEAADAVRRREISAVELLDDCLQRISERDADLNAFVLLDEDGARACARAVDARIARGDDPGPLAGVPFGVKDLEDLRGLPTTQGSLLYKDAPPAASDSVHVARLRAAGAVPVGKTAVPEFGAYAYTHTKAWGTTRNPWDPSRTPGGSSGGSAAAVAAAMVPFCTASDGGGSTRIPAAFCGLVGMKATLGRVPNPNLRGSYTSVWGALTTSVADSARHLDAASGPDERDRTSLPHPGVSYQDAIETLDVRGLRAVYSPDYGFAVVDPETESLARVAAERLVEAAGLHLVERPVGFTEPVKLWLGLGAVDIFEDIERGMWPERAGEFTDVMQYNYRHSERMTVEQYSRALKRRRRLQLELAAVFDDVDLVLSPTTARPAFDAPGPMPWELAGQRLSHPGMNVPFTMVANLCWNPACSVPAGVTADGLPVGLQIMARRHDDHVVLRLARIAEQCAPFPRFAPGYS